MTIRVEPLPGATVYVDDDGRIVFKRWHVSAPFYDDDGKVLVPTAMAIIDYIREQVEKENE